MNDLLIHIQDAVPRMAELMFKNPINFQLRKGEHWTFTGPNGAGKTLLADLLTGKIVLKSGKTEFFSGDNSRPLYKQIKMVTFQDVYSMADYKQMYYQQRWNSSETEETPLVEELVKDLADSLEIYKFFDLLGVTELLKKRIILLSSGELRKFLIVRTLLLKPKILILDNPYIGLDASSRETFNELLAEISRQEGIQTILLLSNPADIPEIITHVLPVKAKTLYPPLTREDFFANKNLMEELFPENNSKVELPQEPPGQCGTTYRTVLNMPSVTIRYGKRTILENLRWEVKKGDKWALLGPNGSGKSTLLSLVYADNPQSYANTFSLFDKKRGSGESIWEIKRRIGYVSPEIHLYYLVNQTVSYIVGSGFFDSIGLYGKCTGSQKERSTQWMKVFGIEDLKDRPFLSLSSGEQRLVILCRAFVKNPELVILDEPLHGLDKSNKALASDIIEEYCKNRNKTLIYVTHYEHEIPSCVTQRLYLKKI